MRLRARIVLLATLLACTREPPKIAGAVDAGPTALPAPSATPPKRCLPVVAAECGCVYSCAAGTETAPGLWSVDHPIWPNKLKAKVAPWCVSGDCTDAFHAEIVCTAICQPKPADHGCHFEGDRCVSRPSTPTP